MFHERLTRAQSKVQQALDDALAFYPDLPVIQAMRYALQGGKRLRAFLVLESARLHGIHDGEAMPAAAAVEALHAYSLVHDDLPAMDDDDLRRGRATCHKAYDEATAILAGDALQTLAFRVLCEDDELCVNRADRLRMIAELAHASGSRGMAGGQALDMEATGREIDLAQLENLHIHKTGALILASVRLGGLAAGASSDARMTGLERYAKCIGLAFQVRDDVLDVEGDTAVLGKTRGKDAATDKATYPALIGLDAAREMTQRLIDEALDNIATFDDAADPLRQLAHYIVGRTR